MLVLSHSATVVDGRCGNPGRVEAGKDALRTGDAGKIRTSLDGLNVAYSAAGASLYQNASTGSSDAPPAGEPGAQQPPKDEPAEADFEVVDEGKK